VDSNTNQAFEHQGMVCYNIVVINNNVTIQSPVLDFQRLQRQKKLTLRQSVLETAIHLLATEGAEALSMRRIADAINASTSVLYTIFGSKDGLANALYLEGYARFGAALQNSIETPKNLAPLQKIERICFAYREFALHYPEYYKAIFLGAIPQFVLQPHSVAEGWKSLHILEDVVRECQAKNLIVGDNPRATAKALWAMGHGAVSLELMGSFLEPEERSRVYQIVVQTAIGGLQERK
jgi:AcrR family transcriptional regulator